MQAVYPLDVPLSWKTAKSLMTRGPGGKVNEANHLGTVAPPVRRWSQRGVGFNHLRRHADSSAPVAEVHHCRWGLY